MTSPMSQTVRTIFVGDFGDMNRGLDNVNGRFKTVATSMKAMAATGLAVAGIAFFKNAIDEAREAEKVTRQTAAVLQSTGGIANVTAGQITGLADKLSKMAGVDDEVIQAGENMMLTFTKVRNEAGAGNDVFNQATEVALDMSAAMGTDLNGAVIKVGKALNNPISGLTALSKVGVQFTDQQKDQIKVLVESGDVLGAQQIILRELKTEFGGMAAASADSMSKLGVAWGNFAEDVGKKVMPAVTGVSNWMLNTGIPAIGKFTDIVGSVLSPVFHGLIELGKGFVSIWNSMPGPIQAGALALGAWALVGGRVTGFLNNSVSPLKNFNTQVKDMQRFAALSGVEMSRFGANIAVLEGHSPAIARMGAAFRGAKGEVSGFGATMRGVASGAMSGMKSAAGGLMNVLGGPWGLAIAGGVALLSLFSMKSAEAEAEQKKLEDAGKSVADAIAEQNGAINANVRAAAAKAAEDAGLLSGMDGLGVSTTRVTDAILGQGQAYEGLRAQLTAIAEGHKEVNTDTGTTLETYDAEGQAAIDLRDKLDGVVNSKDNNVAASQRVAAAAQTTEQAETTARTATELFGAAIESAGVEFDESASLADQLRQAIDLLTAAEMAQIDTLESYEAAQDALTAAVQQNGRTLNIHTEAGRRNRDALEDVAKKSRDLMQADIDSGVPMNLALKRHNDRIAALKTEAAKTFGAKSEAIKLINTYSKVPKNVKTAITTSGYEAVNRQMMDLSSKQFLLSRGMPITPSNLRAVQKEKSQQRNRAYGGPIIGPGGPTSDKVPLWGSAGEFMHQASAVDYYGLPFMHAVNQKRFPKEMFQGLASGGMVWPFPVSLKKTKIPEMFSGSLGALQKFALAQKGKTYLWGATGPGHWDCSGLVGAIWALAHGKNPYQRYMTTASMGVGRYGMKAGRGPITVYLGAGHTAANIGGLHAEAYGGNGVPLAIGRIGTPLSYYHTVMHMAKGGAINRLRQSAGNRMASFMKTGWPEIQRFDGGGVWKNGTLGANTSGGDEMVINPKKTALENHYHLHLNVANNPVDVVTQFERMRLMAQP